MLNDINLAELTKLTIDELKMLKYELIGQLNNLKKSTRLIDKVIKLKLKK